MALDFDQPINQFDGGGGSLLLGDGWEPAQTHHGDGETFDFSWAVDGRASIWVEQPLKKGPWILWGKCRPYRYPDAPPQTISLLADDDQVVAETALDRTGWQRWRLPIPEDHLQPGLNELVLQFGYAVRPVDVLPDTQDSRRLSAACRTLALVSQGSRAVDEVIATNRFDTEERHLRLAPGAAAAFPLPVASTVTLQLGEVVSECGGCIARFELVSGDRRRELLQGKAAEISEGMLSFSTPQHQLARLVVRWLKQRGQDAPLELRLPHAPKVEPLDVPRTHPHVFVYLIDTLRADTVAPYDTTAPTPEIAAFADDAVTSHAWSSSAWTLPSVASLFTGVYPHRHGTMVGSSRLSAEGPTTLATHLGEVGYGTVGLSQSMIVSDRFGLDRGFDRYVLNDQLGGYPLRSQDLRRYLYLHGLTGRVPLRPLFAYVHTVGPHSPYAPVGDDRRFADAHPGDLPQNSYLPLVFGEEGHGSKPDELAHLMGLYRGEVAYADRQFGRFVRMLRFLGLYDQSLIVLLSDHGEEFGEHGGFDHGRSVYEEILRVPLLVKYPGAQWGGTVVPDRVSTVDVLPTILAAAGLEVPTDLDGEPLQNLSGPHERRRRPIFAELSRDPGAAVSPLDYRVLAVGREKCIESRTGFDQFGQETLPWQVFDLEQDPGELAPFPLESQKVARCDGMSTQWWAAREALQTAPTEPPETDPEILQRLRALGYIQ